MKSNKILYGFMAIAPLVLVIGAIVPIVISLIDDPNARNPPALAIVGISMLLLGALLMVVGLILFMVHAAKNKTLNDGERIGWMVGLIMSFLILTGFVSSILTIVYFFMYIAKDRTPPASSTSVGWDSKSNY